MKQIRIGKLLKVQAAISGNGVRERSVEIGVSPSTISRLERGHRPDGETTIKLINWLFSETEEEIESAEPEKG